MLASTLPLLIPSGGELLGLAAVFAAALLMMLVGRMLAGGRGAPELCLVAGWGALSFVMTLWAVLTPLSLYVPAGLFAAAGLVALALPRFRPSREEWIGVVRILALSVPIWMLMASARPALPDTFTNFLPNAVYLFDHGVLPGDGRAPIFSVWPAFPYNLQFAGFLAGLFTPDFPPAALAHFNILLQVMFALFLARLLERGDETAPAAPRWSSCAIGLLATTLLNPGFSPKVSFSSYAEPSIAVTLALAAWLASRSLGQLVAGRSAARDLWLLSLVLAAMIGIKQVAAPLGAGLIALVLLVAVAERRAALARIATRFAIACSPAILMYGLWRVYVLTRFRTFPDDGELKLLPVSRWDAGLIPDILGSMAHIAVVKVTFFSLAAALMVWAVAAVRRRGYTPETRFLAVAAGMFPYYWAFLVFAYVAHMGGESGAGAHSFFRYNAHLSLLMAIGALLFLRGLPWQATALPLERLRRAGPAALVALVLVSPFGFVDKLRFDLAPPQPFIWRLAKETAARIRSGEKLALVLPGDNGSVARAMRVILEMTPPRRRYLDLYVSRSAGKEALREAARAGYRQALVSCATAEVGGAAVSVAAFMRYAHGVWTRETLLGYPPASAVEDRLLRYPGEPFCYGDVGSLRIP